VAKTPRFLLFVNGRRWGNFELAYRDEAMRI
jgi:hypothetical protein